MFAADFSKLTSQSVLTAMGHAFFTLSLGIGTVMVYGSYMSNDQSISNAVIIVAGLDAVIALIAGMAIFPLVFASGLAPGSGPGLLFETLPIAFSGMWGGTFFGTGFFCFSCNCSVSSSDLTHRARYRMARKARQFALVGHCRSKHILLARRCGKYLLQRGL